MRQKEEKPVFINRIKNEIECRELLAQFFNTSYKELLNSFNGKVFNKRVINAIEAELKKLHPRGFVTSESFSKLDPYSNCANSYYNITIGIYTDRNNYVDKETICTKILVNDARRVDYEKTVGEKYVNIWFENFCKITQELRETTVNYDKFYKTAKAVADAIEIYKNLPFRFRQNIRFTQSFYLNS